jgi:hypothetical protein
VCLRRERGDMHEKPEKRDVVDNINPEGGHDNEKTADVHEKPEKRDDINSNFDFNFDLGHEYDDDTIETLEMQTHERPEKRDGASSPSFTYHIRQSSTKTEAVLRYVEFPILNQLGQFVTPLSNTEPVKSEKRDVTINTNLEGRYDDKEMAEKQVCKQPEQRDLRADINLKGEHNEEKTVKKQPYEKPERRDVVVDNNPEGKDDEEEVVEKQQRTCLG